MRPGSQLPTPHFLYDLKVLRERARRLKAAMPGSVLFGVKANPNHEVLCALHGALDGLDIASEGELDRALAAGFEGTSLHFAGPGKTSRELARALEVGATISLESLRELSLLEGTRAHVRLRINPSTRFKSYRVSMTGLPSPFGIDEEVLEEAVHRVMKSSVVFEGIHVHPGAQCTNLKGFHFAAAYTVELARRVQRLGLPVRTINFGGGLGVLPDGTELDVEGAGALLREVLEGTSFHPIIEPGRWLAAPMGTYVARVVSVKRSRGQRFVVLDGGLNHFMSATGLLGPPLPLKNLSRPDAPVVACSIVGPLCTPFDSFGTHALPEPVEGDLIGIANAGAYGPSFSPLGFLSHGAPAELIA